MANYFSVLQVAVSLTCTWEILVKSFPITKIESSFIGYFGRLKTPTPGTSHLLRLVKIHTILVQSRERKVRYAEHKGRVYETLWIFIPHSDWPEELLHCTAAHPLSNSHPCFLLMKNRIDRSREGTTHTWVPSWQSQALSEVDTQTCGSPLRVSTVSTLIFQM